ncbi:hypothetical protein A2U01_0030588, partial [Trifolium medium]|nr:hypothetical protein [Trifolium medium]
MKKRGRAKLGYDTLDGIVFQGVDPVEVLALTVPFTTTEIDEVVLSSNGD